MQRIYVCNIVWEATDEDFKAWLVEQGYRPLEVKIIKENDTGRSRGFGFVKLASEEEARDAIEKLDGLEYQGRTLHVAEAHERKRGGGGSGSRGDGQGGGPGDRGAGGGSRGSSAQRSEAGPARGGRGQRGRRGRDSDGDAWGEID